MSDDDVSVHSECDEMDSASDDEPDDVLSNHSSGKDDHDPAGYDLGAASSDEADDDDTDTIGSSEIYTHEQLVNKRKKKNEPNLSPIGTHKAVENISVLNANVAQMFLMYDSVSDAYDDLHFLLHNRANPPSNAFKERLENELKKHKTTLDLVDGVEQCKKCLSKKLYTCQMQTRSGDESMTTFYVCSKCASKWKT
jgi:DNA-directed RNA polymerase subunit M/transcription elongation factor TFIIS